MKAALYCRLSEEDRNKHCATDDSNSIQNQKAMLLQYAAQCGWEVTRIYSDDDYTGSDRQRPAFRQLLLDAEQRQFDIILCKTQSRFTRELELVERYIHGLFPVWGIRFVSIVDHADTASKGNKKSRQINGLVNEWYLEDLSENIRSVLDSRRRNGLHIGAFALYGYRKDPYRKGHLLIDDTAAAVVREVFRLYASGMGKTAIARLLNERGIPNPTEYKRQLGLRYKQPHTPNSTLWRYSSIAAMLTNPIYIGTMVQGRYGSVSYKTRQNKPRPKKDWYVVENTHEAIISRELWERVQALLAQRSKPFGNGHIGLFAGKVICAGCGYAMRTSVSRGVRYLKCGSRSLAGNVCEGSFIRLDRLEQLVREELQSLSEQYLDRAALEGNVVFAGGAEQELSERQREVALYQQRVAEYTHAVRCLYMDKVKGVLSGDVYAEVFQSIQKDRESCQRLLHEAAGRAERLKERLQAGESRQMLVDRYLHPEQLCREAVEWMVDHIEVGKRIPGTRHVPVCIHWLF